MKKTVLFFTLLLLCLLTANAQTFKVKKGGQKQLTLMWYGKLKTDKSGYEWQNDCHNKDNLEKWTLHDNGAFELDNSENDSGVGWYKTSTGITRQYHSAEHSGFRLPEECGTCQGQME